MPHPLRTSHTEEIVALQRAIEDLVHAELRDERDSEFMREAMSVLAFKLAQTPDARVDVFALRRAGWTNQRIADLVGCTEGNIRRIIKRGPSPRSEEDDLRGECEW